MDTTISLRLGNHQEDFKISEISRVGEVGWYLMLSNLADVRIDECRCDRVVLRDDG
jgi:hypothetical protein